MGSGKSSVGKELAILLDWDFFDLDQLVTEQEGRSVSRIFAEDGEQAFRDSELAALRHFFSYRHSPVCHSKEGSVLSLGGGSVMQPEALELIRKHSTCIYLQAGLETLFNNLSKDCGNRPLLAGSDDGLRKRISELMSHREGTYLEAADLTVTADGLTPAEIAVRIRERIGI